MHRLVLVVLSLVVASTSVANSQQCNIAEEKKRLIATVLCGDAAPEREYKFSGSGCVFKSTQQRMADSALQIYAYQKCGEPLFAIRLGEATIKATQFVQTLAVCGGERIDINQILEQALKDVQVRYASLQCAAVKDQLEKRKPVFEQLIQQANDPSTVETIYQKLGITVDRNGDVKDKQ
jgi:hypothetical protein